MTVCASLPTATSDCTLGPKHATSCTQWFLSGLPLTSLQAPMIISSVPAWLAGGSSKPKEAVSSGGPYSGRPGLRCPCCMPEESVICRCSLALFFRLLQSQLVNHCMLVCNATPTQHHIGMALPVA
jgi:hypothetical protein